MEALSAAQLQQIHFCHSRPSHEVEANRTDRIDQQSDPDRIQTRTLSISRDCCQHTDRSGAVTLRIVDGGFPGTGVRVQKDLGRLAEYSANRFVTMKSKPIVLVVEDDRDQSDLVVDIINETGLYQSIPAYDGEHAFSILKGHERGFNFL